MVKYRPPDYLPAEILERPDFAEACAERDLGRIFRISIKYAAGFTPSHLARRCDMTVSKVQDYARDRTIAQSMAVFERVSDGLHVPGHMLGIVTRPWEMGNETEVASFEAGSDVTAAYSGRALVTRRQWNRMIADTCDCIWLYGMAEFGYATDDDVPGLLSDASAKGCEIRVLLLDPGYSGLSQIDADEGSPVGTLSVRIMAALARFLRMQQACGGSMSVRVYDSHPTVSVIRGDDRMIVTPYLRFFTGSNSPTFELHSHSSSRLFDRYVRHFGQTWKCSREWK